MAKRVLFFATLLTLTTVTVSAQDGRLLTIDQAIELTVTNNPEMKALVYEEEAALREKRAATGLRMPQIGVTGVYAYLGDDISIDLNPLKAPISGIVGGMGGLLPPAVLQQAGALLAQDWDAKLQDRSFGSVAANITVPVYTGGKINAANRAAKINLNETQQKGRQSKDALITELSERYYGLLLATQVVQVRQQVLAGMKKHLEDAVALEANGIIARAERLYAEVHVAEAERELFKAQKDAETLRSALANTLNVDVNYIPSSDMFILNDIEPAQYFKDLAQTNSPLLKQVSLKHDLAKEGVRLKRADFAPQVALMGATSLYNYQVSHIVPKWGVGAGISFKIFDGLHREYQYGAAKSKVKQVEAIEVKAQNNIMTLIDKLYNEMSSYNSQLPSLDASSVFAQEYLRIKEEAFKEGMAPSSDVVDAQLNLAKIKISRIQAAYYYDIMLARLLEACGMSESLPEYSKDLSAIQIRYE